MTYQRPGVYLTERLLPAQINTEGIANAAGAVVGAFAQGPEDVTLVTSWYQFVNTYGGYNTLFPATYGVGLFFQNGGSELYVKRVLHSGDATPANNAAAASVSVVGTTPTRAIGTQTPSGTTNITITTGTAHGFAVGDSVVIAGVTPTGYNGTWTTQTGTTNSTLVVNIGSNPGAITVAGTVQLAAPTVATVTAKNKGVDGNNLRVQFTASATPTVGSLNYFDLVVYKEGGAASTSGDVSNDVVVEQFNNITFNDASSNDYIGTVISQNSDYISVSNINSVYPPTSSVFPLVSGTNGIFPVVADYTAVMSSFTEVNRPLVIFAPEIIASLGSSDGKSVQNALVGWADAHESFAVLDTPSGLTATGALAYSAGLTKSSSAAVYYPNVYISDPNGRSSSSLRKVGAAGAVAGLFIQTDKSVGPFKAPAGLYASLRGAVALEKALTSSDLDALNSNSAPINAIRNIPGAGIVSMGTRTLLQDGTANKYVNMRRSLNYIRRNLESMSEFALFENNDEKLWLRIRTSLSVFLNTYRNQGGLRGETPDVSFYVKCDAENNTLASIANGEVHIEVGVALQYPAEFVVINLSQKTAV